MFQTKTQPHCGHCSQCVDRRFAILAAGLQAHDPAKGYASDVFVGLRKDPLERAIALDYVRHGLELARKSESDLAASFSTELSRAVRHLEGRSETARAIISMHKRHGEVVSRVLEQQLRANAAEFVDGTLEPTSLLAMVATRRHLTANDQALVTAMEKRGAEGKAVPSVSDKSSVAAILNVIATSVQNLHSRIDEISIRKARKRTSPRLSKRDVIIFAAIFRELKSIQYCSFLKEHGVKPRWSEPCPGTYRDGYQKGNPWRKKIQDEKCRAKRRMQDFTSAALADAFNFYLPDQFTQLSGLLNSRNSRPASKS